MSDDPAAAAEERAYLQARAGGFPCRVCGKTWTGANRCHCASCHESFSTVGNFDKHRRNGKCLDPSSKGLVLVDGYWQGLSVEQEWRFLPEGKTLEAA